MGMFGICKPTRNVQSVPITAPTVSQHPTTTTTTTTLPTTPQIATATTTNTTTNATPNGTCITTTEMGICITTPINSENGDIYVRPGMGMLRDGNLYVQVEDELEPVTIMAIKSITKSVEIYGDLIVHGKIINPMVPLNPLPLDNQVGQRRHTEYTEHTEHTEHTEQRHTVNRRVVNVESTDENVSIKLPISGKGIITFRVFDSNLICLEINVKWDSFVETIPLIFTQFICDDVTVHFKVLGITDEGMTWLIYNDDTRIVNNDRLEYKEYKVFYTAV